MNQPSNAPPFGYQAAFHQGPYPYPAGSYPMDIVSPNTLPQTWAPYNGQHGVGTEDDDNENVLTKKIAGVPVWGWAAGLAVLGIGGYVVYKQMQPGGMLAKNEDEDEDEAEEDEAELRANKKWKPSRGEFAPKIEAFLKKNGIRGVKIYTDADDAAKTIKTPSPLITLRAPRSAALHTNPAFVAVCEEDGLKPVETADGIVGLYPGKGVRGKAWGKYVDDLRDEGQEI